MSSLLDDLDALLSDEDELIVVKPTGTRRESPSEAVFGGASTSILGTNTLSKDAMSDFADFSDEEDGMFSDEGADEAGSRNEVGTKIVVEDNEFDDELERLGKRSAIKGVARLADSNRFQEHMKVSSSKVSFLVLLTQSTCIFLVARNEQRFDIY